jgi:YVTN family beta-propeller protein
LRWVGFEVLRLAGIGVTGFLLVNSVLADPLPHPKIAPARDVATVQATALDQVQQFEQDGVRIEFSLRAVEPNKEQQDAQVGQTALAQFALRDSRTGQPLSLGRPKAWMNARLSETVAGEKTCADKVRSLASGQLGSRAEIDLNSYAIATLNHDMTITFINPHVSFSPTKLEHIVSLPGIGTDWLLTKDGRFLYVALSDEATIAVIDTTTYRLIQTISTGAGSRPARLTIQPDGRAVWVGLDGTGQVLVLNPETHSVTKTIAVGEGPHAFAFSDHNAYLAVTNGVSNTVSLIDLHAASVTATLPVGKTPVTVAYGTAAKRFYVGLLNDNTLMVIDPVTHNQVATIPTQPGVVALRFEPTGRYAVAVNQLESRIAVIDTATNTVIGSTRVVKDPDQVTFTERYAYVRGIESEKFSLIDLVDLRKGKPAPVEIQAGQHAPSTAPDQLGIAEMIVPAPEGNAVLVANAPDQTLYFYQEGMMAPMGTFSNYKRMPRGILVLDRSLKEVAPGVYRAPVTFTKAGRYDVPLLIDRPRTMHCFQVTVKDSEIGVSTAAVPKPPIVRTHFGTEPVQARVPTALAFTLTDPATQQPIMGIRDVQVLLFEPPGTWQHRQHAREVEPGRYAITQSFPHAGEYRVMVQTLSQRLRYADGVPAVLQVVSSTVQSTKQMQRAAGRRP